MVFAPSTSLEYWFSIAVFFVFAGVVVFLSFWMRPRPSRSALRKWLWNVAILLVVPPLVLGGLLITVFSGLPILQGQLLHYHKTLLVAVTIAMAAILYIETTVHINEWVDFSIDDYEYDKGESISLMISNLGQEDLDLTNSNPIWTVYRDDHFRDPNFPSPKPVHLILPKKQTGTGRVGWSERRWLIPTDHLTAGVYRVVYNGPVYFRTGHIVKQFKLLSPNEIKNHPFQYDSFYDAAQRFRVIKPKPAQQPTSPVPRQPKPIPSQAIKRRRL
jgi:hypothetical protein